MRYSAVLSLAALAFVGACNGSDSPTAVSNVSSSRLMVITEGAPAPAPRPTRPSLSVVDGSVGSTAVGSSTTPLSLTPSACPATATGQVKVIFLTSGRQDGTATFSVYTKATYDGATHAWSYSAPTTITVGPRGTGPVPPQENDVTLTVENASAAGAGTVVPNIVLTPSNITNTNQTGAKLGAGTSATVHVTFVDCAHVNTSPSLTVPSDITAEATSSAGAAVSFSATASDLEDGDLTSSVSCDHASGDTFPLGTTTVTCAVTDAGGLTTTGSFHITIVDTTPAYFTSFPTSTITLIAADIHGATLDLGSLGIAVADVNHVSEPSTFGCDYTAGTVLPIGSTTTVSCTAKDARGNESAPSTFDVFIGLNVDGTGFLAPLRMTAPFSVHKRGSTIPHKFLPPTYADGTPATDLADGLRLVIELEGAVDGASIDVNDYSAGSTAWRYDTTAGQYIFNLKSSTAWSTGSWRTTVSYQGIVLATTTFGLK